ncbi:divalent-cation tolerance protein CutA [Roseivivax isoporae]|uniref:Cytochrome C biogenesis protein CcdA n=1 Tax=Roseivivax isoporae LMG 25204 TaxID=1449351 RepID=X7FAZ5_9RHOB|nr:divalent-cation tolerance protein CutA [Roseivivax isoporae]ETX30042.1 cytochrome C biogenesis protein CcdA [Roseivivax isoporae LMG 25204]
MTDILAVFTTLPDADSARALARLAVTERRAACVQISEIASVYTWEGVQEDREWRLLFKTTRAGYPALAALILKAHPYDEPALWSHVVSEGSAGYLAWIADSVAP